MKSNFIVIQREMKFALNSTMSIAQSFLLEVQSIFISNYCQLLTLLVSSGKTLSHFLHRRNSSFVRKHSK